MEKQKLYDKRKTEICLSFTNYHSMLSANWTCPLAEFLYAFDSFHRRDLSSKTFKTTSSGIISIFILFYIQGDFQDNVKNVSFADSFNHEIL